MQTFRDVLAAPRDLGVPPRPGEAVWPPRGGRQRLIVPGDSPFTLPIEPAGYEPVAEVPALDPVLGDRTPCGIVALLTQPSLVVPLRPPSLEALCDLGYDSTTARPSHKPRSLGLAVELDAPGGGIWGVGRLVTVEGALRPGSNLLLQQTVEWTCDLEYAELLIARMHADAAEHLPVQPEPHQPAWPTIVVLLGDAALIGGTRDDWQRVLTLTAGVHAARLQVRVSPDRKKSAVIHDLRTNPPDAVLVWERGVTSAPSYIKPYLTARHSGYAEMFGSQESASLDDHVQELLMHLRDAAPLRVASRPEPGEPDWGDVARRVEELIGDHFAFSGRGLSMLTGNPYPRPARMLWHIERLEALARRYSAAGGDLGARLADVAIMEHEIEIALTDAGLSPPEIVGFSGLVAEPHVKVDDYKSPEQCGRIYFAIDKIHRRFVVDHVGLHNYS